MTIKAYLFSNNKSYAELLIQVVKLLEESKISIKFLNGGIFKKENQSPETIFSRDMYWYLCNEYRVSRNIPATDLVILITPNHETKDYFSYFDGISKNIFVVGSKWDLYTEAQKQFPIAHQVIENTLQCLSRFDDSKFAHKQPIGCINDQCDRKEDIILKLRCADICSDCIQKFIKGGISNSLIFQTLKFLQEIRSGFLLQNAFVKNIQPLVLSTYRAKNKLKIKVENVEIRFTQTEIFIYYIVIKSAKKGFNFNNPDNSIIELIIKEFEYLKYQNINSYLGAEKMKNLLKYISKINEKLVSTLGPQLASNYTIGKNGKGSDLPYTISLFKRDDFGNFINNI